MSSTFENFLIESILDPTDPHDVRLITEKFKRVVRGGVVVKKKVKDKSKSKGGYKIDQSGKTVKMTPAEILKRKKGARKAVKKKKGHKGQILKRRAKSLKKRKAVISK